MSHGELDMAHNPSNQANGAVFGLGTIAKVLGATFLAITLIDMRPAAADPQVKANDIVAFFAKSASSVPRGAYASARSRNATRPRRSRRAST